MALGMFILKKKNVVYSKVLKRSLVISNDW